VWNRDGPVVNLCSHNQTQRGRTRGVDPTGPGFGGRCAATASRCRRKCRSFAGGTEGSNPSSPSASHVAARAKAGTVSPHCAHLRLISQYTGCPILEPTRLRKICVAQRVPSTLVQQIEGWSTSWALRTKHSAIRSGRSMKSKRWFTPRRQARRGSDGKLCSPDAIIATSLDSKRKYTQIIVSGRFALPGIGVVL
jgi:hypothetical protein